MIKKLKSNQSPGPDNIPAELIKFLNDSNKQVLLAQFNDVLMNGTYPDSLNRANIASVYRKGNPAKLENYRPIALLQTFYKILAALIKNRIEPVLEHGCQKRSAASARKGPRRRLFS